MDVIRRQLTLTDPGNPEAAYWPKEEMLNDTWKLIPKTIELFPEKIQIFFLS